MWNKKTLLSARLVKEGAGDGLSGAFGSMLGSDTPAEHEVEHLIAKLITYDIVWAHHVTWYPGDYYDDTEHARKNPQAFVDRPLAFELCFVLDGSLNFRREGKDYLVSKGQAMLWPLQPLYPYESPRFATTKTGAEWMVVHFVARMCGRVHLLEHLPLPAIFTPNVSQARIMETLMRYVSDELWDRTKKADRLYFWEPRDFSHALLGEACTQGLLGICWEVLGPATVLGEEHSVLPDWLSSALKAIHADPFVSIAELAESIGYSSSQFRRLFRDYMGMSPQHYVQQYRLRMAQGLLATTDLPIGAISEQLGFDNVSNFSRFFTRAYGLQPTQYRKIAGRPGKNLD